MLYKVRIEDTTGYVYFLFEHKSYPDRLIPLILYHGKEKWTVDKRFSSLFEGPSQTLAGYISDFEFILYDLSRYTDEQIRGTIMARVTMLFAQACL